MGRGPLPVTHGGGATVAAWDDARSQLVVAGFNNSYTWDLAQPARTFQSPIGYWWAADVAHDGSDLLLVTASGNTVRWGGDAWVDAGFSYPSDFLSIDELSPGVPVVSMVKLGSMGCSGTR